MDNSLQSSAHVPSYDSSAGEQATRLLRFSPGDIAAVSATTTNVMRQANLDHHVGGFEGPRRVGKRPMTVPGMTTLGFLSLKENSMKSHLDEAKLPVPWNKGRLVGQKAPLKLKEIWAIRIRLQLAEKTRDLALFNLAIDSKLRGCDLISLRVCDVAQGKSILPRAMVMQRKTHRPVQFEITEPTQQSIAAWIEKAHLAADQCLFPSRVANSPHLSTRQYARIVTSWVGSIGSAPAAYGTHTMRRTKATLIYGRTKNLRAVQLLPLGIPNWKARCATLA
jgi:integrase